MGNCWRRRIVGHIRCSREAPGIAFTGLGVSAPMTTGEDMRDRELPGSSADAKVVFWHRELPPLDADAIGEHVLEATSCRVPGTIAHRDDLWYVCYEDLMRQATNRLEQEVARLGGQFAHVLDEVIDSRRDEAKREAWLRGRFKYVLYRRAPTEHRAPVSSAAP
jgi:hypothetical protein